MFDFENRDCGWISIHRSIQDKSWYSDPSYLSLWIHLLVSANYEDGFFDGLEVKRGQLITGRKKLSKKTGINESKIERILTFFEDSEQQIEQQKTNKYRIITIKNYDIWQNVNSKVNSSPPQSNRRRTTKNTNNNNNNFNKNNNLDILKIREDLKAEWINQRKKNKWAVSDRVLSKLSKTLDEAENAGYNRNEVMEEVIDRNWQGLQISWLQKTDLLKATAQETTEGESPKTTRPGKPGCFFGCNGQRKMHRVVSILDSSKETEMQCTCYKSLQEFIDYFEQCGYRLKQEA